MRGVPDSEIEAVFAKYDQDGDMMLNAEEQQKLKEKELLEDQRKICKKKKQGNNFLKFLICCP